MGMTISPEAYRLVAVKQALKIHVQTQGRMKLTRSATPTRLLELASEYTGKQYRRGEQAQALADIQQVLDNLVATH
jgi:hypothetical protein